MLVSDDKKHVLELLNSANDVAIVVPPTSGKDVLAAATAFYRFVRSKDKNCKVVFNGEDELIDVFKPFARIERGLGETSLVISFDYKDTPIEKVSYETENGTFFMRIFPVNKDFDTSRIRYKFLGPSYDLFIIIGAKSLGALGDIHEKNSEELKKGVILNIDINNENERFGTINVVEPSFKSLTSLVFSKLYSWEFIPDNEAVEAMLLGLRKES